VSEVAPSVTRVLVCENDPIMRSALCDLIESVPALQLVGSAADADAAAIDAIAESRDVNAQNYHHHHGEHHRNSCTKPHWCAPPSRGKVGQQSR